MTTIDTTVRQAQQLWDDASIATKTVVGNVAETIEQTVDTLADAFAPIGKALVDGVRVDPVIAKAGHRFGVALPVTLSSIQSLQLDECAVEVCLQQQLTRADYTQQWESGLRFWTSAEQSSAAVMDARTGVNIYSADGVYGEIGVGKSTATTDWSLVGWGKAGAECIGGDCRVTDTSIGVMFWTKLPQFNELNPR